jgi:hypothetical protein
MKTMAHLNLKVVALGAAAFLAGSAALPLLAQNSPVGVWDFVLSGPQRGLIQLTFSNDFTLRGKEIITERPHTNHRPDEEDVRTPGGDHRGFDDNGSSATHIIWAGANVFGNWTYDSSGRVIGAFTELSLNLTNGISFAATVRPNVRMNMVGHRLSNGRRITYRGVPFTPVPDLSGNFYASGTRDGKPITELLMLTPGTTNWFPSPNANNYDLVGTGPSYLTIGYVIVSPQKQVAVYTQSSESTNGLLRTITGSFNPTTGAGKTLLGLSEDPDPAKTEPLNVRTSLIKQ